MIISVLLIAVGIVILSSLWHLYRAPRVQRAVLKHMLERSQPVYGLDMIKDKSLPRGSAYVFLAEMEKDGLIASSLERVVVSEGMMRRRVYQLTDKGRAVAQILATTKKEAK